MVEMSRYHGRRSRGNSRLVPLMIALFVAIAAIVLVIVNVTKDKTPADDPVDNDLQQDVLPPDDGTEDDDGAVEDEPQVQHVTIEIDGDEQQYDAVYRVGDAGFEMYSYVESTAKKYADNINAVADAVEGSAKVYMIPAPLSSGITLPDALYGKNVFSDQKAAEDAIIGFMNDNVISVPLNKVMMAHRGEYIYFRTDHHWTATGAYYAYDEFCKLSGKTANPLEGYETVEFPGYLGTFYSAANENSQMAANPDTVVAYYPLSADAILYYGENKDAELIRWPIIYDESNAPASNKYGTFIGGDQPYTVIENPAVTDGSSCVVIKESYGNAFVPFLVDHYQTVYVLDCRYWEGSISEFVKTNDVDEVLFVNNLSAIRSSYIINNLHDIL